MILPSFRGFDLDIDIDAMKEMAGRAIQPLKSTDLEVYGSRSTAAGQELPEYYLCYFLLVDLLGFKCYGPDEKVAWSIPVEIKGHRLVIEHRKSGLGVFAHNESASENAAGEVVQLVRRGVRAAQPYFEWRAHQAVNDSKINVINRCRYLYQRYEFMLGQYVSKMEEVEASRGTVIKTEHGTGYSMSFPEYGLEREAEWLATAVVESFFSWTEHVFVHMAILNGGCKTGEDVKDLAKVEWKDKFKAALGLDDRDLKRFYDKLTTIRYQIRNFVAHGAFGKAGEAFKFHSDVGAVPVQLPHRQGEYSYRFSNSLLSSSDDQQSDRYALVCIKEFVDYIRSGDRLPAWMFLDAGFDVVLNLAQDGTYQRAMGSVDDMHSFIDYWSWLEDRYANMEW